MWEVGVGSHYHSTPLRGVRGHGLPTGGHKGAGYPANAFTANWHPSKGFLGAIATNFATIAIILLCSLCYTERINLVLLTWKVESLAELKFDPGFRVIVEYLSPINSVKFWHEIESHLDSNILQLLGIPGRILVPPMTQLFRSNYIIFSFIVLVIEVTSLIGRSR